jgi:putative flippase GtrA/GT2 family glycosyltransferase
MITSPIFTQYLPKGRGALRRYIKRFAKFASVGVANTLIDIGVLNLLLWLFPTTSQLTLMQYNATAVLCGACNSFFWNKYWTFHKAKNKIHGKEIRDFLLVTWMTIFVNTFLLLSLSHFYPGMATSLGWQSTLLKVLSIGGTFLLSFLGMQFLVFRDRHEAEAVIKRTVEVPETPYDVSLSVVFPAYNEEGNIHQTIYEALFALPHLVRDYEIIVVNDGSKDGTGAIADAIACTIPERVTVIHHSPNKGYGAALTSGFLAASKEFTFYMDSDGQFDIRDLARLLPQLEQYDGVFGYRIDRQDTFFRKCISWGWNSLMRFIFRIHIRDIDGAFKIFRTAYFQDILLETRGAMIDAELIYKFSRAGYTYTEVGVTHYPRTKGESSGGNPLVILKAFKELLYYANKWSTEETL